MAEAAQEWFMTNDFLGLDTELKNAMYEHCDEREKLAAETAAPPPPEGGAVAPGAPAAPGGLPPGMPQLPDIGGVL